MVLPLTGKIQKRSSPPTRLGLPGNEDMIIGSALTPVLESVSALLAPA